MTDVSIFIIKGRYFVFSCTLNLPLPDISMSGVVELIALYSERVTDSSYRMSNIPSLSDVKVQEYVDTKVDWIKTFIFSGKTYLGALQ